MKHAHIQSQRSHNVFTLRCKQINKVCHLLTHLPKYEDTLTTHGPSISSSSPYILIPDFQRRRNPSNTEQFTSRRMRLLIVTFLALSLNAANASPLVPRQATNGPRPPTIIWSCTANTDPSLDIPSVCSNMCYGAYCRGYSSSLWFDPMAIGLPFNITALRKANAGCYYGVDGQPANEPDRCQSQGMACNVYPYITAVEFAVDAEQGGPVSRCVDRGEDARE